MNPVCEGRFSMSISCQLRYGDIVRLWHYGLCQAVFFWLDSVLWWGSAALRCDTAVYSALAGSEWCDGNRRLLCFWGCGWDHATLFLKRALLMVACFMKYPTRVSIREQKCSFGVHMYVPHRGAIVSEGVCMIWSIRNGWERLTCLPGICITIPGIHYYLL